MNLNWKAKIAVYEFQKQQQQKSEDNKFSDKKLKKKKKKQFQMHGMTHSNYSVRLYAYQEFCRQ